MVRLEISAMLAAIAAFATGCHTTRSLKNDITDAVGVTQYSAPASLQSVWQKQVSYLANPARNGDFSPGIVGQVFLWDADKSAVKVDGDLYVMLRDETPGKTPLTPEMFHFDNKTLKKLITHDERWGQCYAVFIPLVPGWEKIDNIRIQTKFVPTKKGAMEVADRGQSMILENSPSTAQSGGVHSHFDRQASRPATMPGMPDMKEYMKQLQDGKKSSNGIMNVQSTSKQGAKPPVMPAVFETPVPPQMPVVTPAAPVIIPPTASIPMPTPPQAPVTIPTTTSHSIPPAMPERVAVPTVTPAPLPNLKNQQVDDSGLPTIDLPVPGR